MKQLFKLLAPPPLYVGPRLLAIVILISAYSLLIVFLDQLIHPGPITKYDRQIAVVNAVILGTLLTFSTNEAKRRWWEGRTLWGQLINDVRNICIRVRSQARLDAAERRRFGGLLMSFPEALLCHLRGECRLQNLRAFADDPNVPEHVPLYVADLIQEAAANWRRDGKLDDVGLRNLDPILASLMNVCGGCERIRNTPLPSSYRALLHHGITLNIALSPVFIANDAGYWTVALMAISTYFVAGVELIAHSIEQPFGADGDDLPLEDYCKTIERSVQQVLLQT